MAPPTQPLPTQRQSFVEQAMNVNAQKQSVEAVTRLGSRFDSVAKIMSQSVQYEKQSIDYLSSMDKNIEKLTKDQKKNTDDIRKAITTVKQTATVQSTAKDHLAKKADPGLLEERKNIRSIADAMQEELALRRAESKKKGFGLLGSLAGLLSVGGLLGFLMTGKEEFLFSMVKGLKHAGKLLTDFLTMPLKLIKGIGGIGKEMADIEKAVVSVTKGGGFFKFIKGMASSLKELNTVSGLINGAKKSVKGVGEIVSHGVDVVKAVGKVGSSGIKNAVEMGKGIKSIFTAGLDIGKMFSSAGGAIGGIMKGGGGLMKGLGKGLGKKALTKIPVLGSILSIFFAIERFKKGDIAGGLLEIGSGVAAIFPGVGTAISMAIDGLLLMNDFGKGGLLNGANTAIKGGFGKVMGMFGGGKEGDAYNVAGGNSAVPIPADNSIFSSTSKVVSSSVKSVMAAAKKSGKTVGVGIKNVVAKAGSALGFMMGRGVDVSGVNPKLWNNFLGMAKDYKAIYGKDIPLNSAYRDMDKQQKLYNDAIVKYGSEAAARKWVAPPGRSMHNFGYALDIGDSAGIVRNELKSSPMGNLASKWGFDFPMDHEAWHIEPKGFKEHYSDVRGGNAVDSPMPNPAVDDAYSIGGGDFNTSSTMRLGSANTKPTMVVLTEETVKALAVAIGSQYRANMPKNNSVAQNIGGKPISVRGR